MVNLCPNIAIAVSEHHPCYHHQAAMHNPNVSAETKEHSRQVVEEIQGSGAVQDDDTTERSSPSFGGGKDENRVLGGYKATLKSQCFLSFDRRDGRGLTSSWFLFTDPNVSDEAKERAEKILEDRGAL
jgi:hypothetical protein